MSEDQKEASSEGITMEQLNKMRECMFEMYTKNYKKFIESIREMPLHENFFHQPMLFFDTATLWMEQVIKFAPLVQKNQPEEKPSVQ